MKNDYSAVIEVANTSNEVYNAINNVPLWWTENFEGSSKKLNDEFMVTFGETFIKLKVAELVNNYKVVWEVTDSFKHFLKNKKEWVGTKICFDIVNDDNQKSILRFTHMGLVNSLECYDICSDAWNGYLQGSLKSLIVTGKGTPDKSA
ncbi:SRPBCC domain-containing protein [Flavihumibacter rivuli]|uniref:SRPBCC domain-containing protein n=1 Tax=Flavihumibacter rivuli TaxID=2838156 RepID=UPI001BDE202F|nr:SRPBCC domain-containing protein [Flavihumibacter rivuli]ULQ56235.1 SRPBCC domain-containing protein [Flavihumibacter rivuli]